MGNEKTYLEWIAETYECTPIQSPFADSTAMVLLTTMGRTMIGSIDEVPDKILSMYAPLLFSEIITKAGPRGEPLEVGMQMTKHLLSLKVLDWVLVRPDFVYYLKANRPHDVDMVNEYGNAVRQIQGQDSDIEVVSPLDARKILMGPAARGR